MSKKKKKQKKKSYDESSLAKILYITAILQLTNAIIDLIKAFM